MAKGAQTTTLGWSSSINISGLPLGSFRSILGYAGESLVIGRALACGYNLFFKAWRDSKYDAVLDSKGILFRIEIKQSGKGKSINATSGGRSGKQINRKAGSREFVLSPEDCEFLVGVNSSSGKCWIVPTEVIQILGKKTLSTSQLIDYEEKWAIFSTPPRGIRLEQLRTGFRKLKLAELQSIAHKLGVTQLPSKTYKFSPRGRATRLPSPKNWYVLEIWKAIFEKLP